MSTSRAARGRRLHQLRRVGGRRMPAVPLSLRRASSRRLLAGSPDGLPTRSRTLGREPAGARTG
eukprot:1319810-Alexandrium_andersonii.AAC.1